MSMCLSHNRPGRASWTFLPGAPAKAAPARVTAPQEGVPRLSPGCPRAGPPSPVSHSRLPAYQEGPMAALSCRLQWRVQEGH